MVSIGLASIFCMSALIIFADGLAVQANEVIMETCIKDFFNIFPKQAVGTYKSLNRCKLHRVARRRVHHIFKQIINLVCANN